MWLSSFSSSNYNEEELLKYWIKHITKLNYLSDSKLKELCYLGIPSSIRVKVWPYLIGNHLQITPHLYEILKSRALLFQINKQQQQKEQKEEQKEEEQHQEQKQQEEEEEKEVIKDIGREESILIIQYDIPRTFPEDIRFHNGSILSISLENILKTYAYYRPDIGYIQGMSYIAAMCLTYLDEYNAFCIFANLLSRQINFKLYLLQPNIIKSFTKTFDYFFQKHLPELYQHMLSECISSDIFLLDWALTLFTKALPAQYASRLWDAYLVDGEIFFIKACLGILEMFEFKLEISIGSGILKLLSKLPNDIDIEKLMNYIVNIPLTLSEYEQIKCLNEIDSSSITILSNNENSNISSNTIMTINSTSNSNSNLNEDNDDDTLCLLKGIQFCFTTNFFLLPTTDKLTKE